jgi:hypothetical protein
MRRYLSALLLLPLIVAATPSNAFALSWYWLDDLSGPKFGGYSTDWRVYCFKEVPRNTPTSAAAALVTKLEGQWTNVDADIARLSKAIGDGDLKTAKEIVGALQAKATDRSPASVRATLEDLAAVLQAPDTIEVAGFFPLSLMVSACTFERNEERRASFDVTVGLFRPQKHFLLLNPKADANPDGNRMFLFEGSYSSRVTSWLELGAGGGIALFTSERTESVKRLVIEPLRVDLRPLARWHKTNVQRVFADGVVVRIGYYIFPQGFPAQTFSDNFAQTGAEQVPYYSVVFDAERLMRVLKTRSR